MDCSHQPLLLCAHDYIKYAFSHFSIVSGADMYHDKTSTTTKISNKFSEPQIPLTPHWSLDMGHHN